MDPLATLGDLTARYPGTLTTDQQSRALALLGDASTVVRTYTRQTFTTATTTERIRPIGDRALLRQAPVTAVTAVGLVDTLQSGNLVSLPMGAWMWDGGQEVWIGAISTVINLPDDVTELLQYQVPLMEVTYSHGYDAVPDPAIAVVCSIVCRALDLPTSGGVASQTVGALSYRLTAAGQDGVLGLTDSERLLLAPYRRSATTVELR